MKTNNIKNIIKDISINVINILFVNCSNFPYKIYNQSNRCGNMAYAGVGLGLINSQYFFWISIIGIGITIFFNNYLGLYLAILLYSFCTYIFIRSIVNTHNMLKYLQKNIS
jgi:hypothetical protein